MRSTPPLPYTFTMSEGTMEQMDCSSITAESLDEYYAKTLNPRGAAESLKEYVENEVKLAAPVTAFKKWFGYVAPNLQFKATTCRDICGYVSSLVLLPSM